MNNLQIFALKKKDRWLNIELGQALPPSYQGLSLGTNNEISHATIVVMNEIWWDKSEYFFLVITLLIALNYFQL